MAGYDEYELDDDMRRRRDDESQIQPQPFWNPDAPTLNPDGSGYSDGTPLPSPSQNALDPSRVPESVRNAPGGMEWAEQFNRTDPGDYSRMEAQFASRNKPTNGGGGNPAASAYGNYLGNTNPLIQGLFDQLKGDRERQAAERAEMRKLLMDRIGQASKPVTQDDPGIRELLAARRLSLERGADRGRAQAAEQRAFEGYGANSDVLSKDVERILEGQAESDSAMTGEVMHGELSAKRQELMPLLQLAVQRGDAESARTLQAQLEGIDQQMTQSRFDSDLGFRQSSFLDDLGLRLALAQLSANQNAAGMFT